jgi:hypothetical protein
VPWRTFDRPSSAGRVPPGLTDAAAAARRITALVGTKNLNRCMRGVVERRVSI